MGQGAAAPLRPRRVGGNLNASNQNALRRNAVRVGVVEVRVDEQSRAVVHRLAVRRRGVGLDREAGMQPPVSQPTQIGELPAAPAAPRDPSPTAPGPLRRVHPPQGGLPAMVRLFLSFGFVFGSGFVCPGWHHPRRCQQPHEHPRRHGSSCLEVGSHIYSLFAIRCRKSMPLRSVAAERPGTKRFSKLMTLRLGSRGFERVALLGIGHGRQPARPSTIPSSGRRTYTTCLRTCTAGRGSRYGPMEDFSTTSSSATQPLHFKVYASRLKNRLVLAGGISCDRPELGTSFIPPHVRTGLESRGTDAAPRWDGRTALV